MPPPGKDRSYEAWLEYLKVKFGIDPETLDNLMENVFEEGRRLAEEAHAREKAGQN